MSMPVWEICVKLFNRCSSHFYVYEADIIISTLSTALVNSKCLCVVHV